MRKIFYGCIYAGLSAAACGLVLLLWVTVQYLLSVSVPKWTCMAALVMVIGIPLLLRRKGVKPVGVIVAILAAAELILVSAVYIGWVEFARDGIYCRAELDKSEIYAGRKVMAIVPHQDDELNILSGVLEEYAAYGSDVYVVFVTNGDFEGITQTRYQEAERVLKGIGFENDHLIFLGYGDQWAKGQPHIYNAASGQVLTSHIGRTETYGVETKAAYNEGHPYTLENLQTDLADVILEYRPDVIFCTDYDTHIDHRAVTLLFDKIMRRILKEEPAYRPAVYKGYAYYTAWIGYEDYYSDNILSSMGNYTELDRPAAEVYRWEDRVRFPVSAPVLSRSLVGSEGYSRLKEYSSQEAYIRADRILNGDKVFWQRDTNSLCLDARMSVSSGNGAVLNDFMLLENNDLLDSERRPYDGVWIPEEGDTAKTVTVNLREPSDIREIVLYDHPSPEQNVSAVRITFADGTSVDAGPLDVNGAKTAIPVHKENVDDFEICILAGEGSEAGLTEIEVFAGETADCGRFLKLTYDQDHFAYDYWTNMKGNALFSVYSYGVDAEVDMRDYEITLSNPLCSWQYRDDMVMVQCPTGEETVLTVTNKTENISDSIWIRNPGEYTRKINHFYRELEKKQHADYCEGNHYRLLQIPGVRWFTERVHVLTEAYIRSRNSA